MYAKKLSGETVDSNSSEFDGKTEEAPESYKTRQNVKLSQIIAELIRFLFCLMKMVQFGK